MIFDPEVWGPHYWFFLHTVSESYPLTPNETTKKKYYDLIINMPLFIPVEEMGNKFSELLDKYPVSPYLDSRDSFVRWVHFIHNKYNVMLGKPEISLALALETYRRHYDTKSVRIARQFRIHSHYVYSAFALTLCYIIYVNSK